MSKTNGNINLSFLNLVETNQIVLELIIYKNHYVLNKKLNVFLGEQDCRFICKRCLNSFTSENMIIKHKQQFNQKQRTSIKTSLESHLHWKYRFHKNPFYFKIYADFEADNEKDNSSVGGKKTNIYISKLQYVMGIE